MTARSNIVAVHPNTGVLFNHLGLAPASASSAPPRRSIAPYALWAVQIALALLFLFAGGSKFVLSADDLTKDTALSATFLRFIGGCEVLGAIGLVGPGLLRIGRFLTPLAAAGLVIIMIGATTVSAVELGAAQAVFPFAVGVLLAILVYARRSWLTARR
jgi:uncharacterized membrane protein YphA (DoxX/SURF4 family)